MGLVNMAKIAAASKLIPSFGFDELANERVNEWDELSSNRAKEEEKEKEKRRL